MGNGLAVVQYGSSRLTDAQFDYNHNQIVFVVQGQCSTLKYMCNYANQRSQHKDCTLQTPHYLLA